MLKRIILKNWKTHLNTEIEFSQGVNCLLGSMGSGKSSVLEAICFALFGTTPSLQSKKLSIADMVMKYPTKKDDAEVIVELEVDGKLYDVIRKINRRKGTHHSEVREDGKLKKAPHSKEVSEFVEKLLGMDYETFSQIIYGEQNRIDFFLSIPPKKRKEKFDELLKIAKLEKARSNLITLINSMKSDVKAKRETLEKLKQEYTSIDVTALKNEIEKLKAELKHNQQRLRNVKSELDRKRKLEVELMSKKKKHEEIKLKMQRLRGESERLKKDLASFQQEQELCKGEGEIKAEIIEIQKRLVELENLEKEATLLKSEKARLLKEIKAAEEEVIRFEKEMSATRSIDSVETELKKVESEQRTIVHEIEKIRARIDEERNALEALEHADARCPVCESPLEESKKKSILDSKRNRMEELKKRISQLNIKNKNIVKKLEKLREERDAVIKFESRKEEYIRNKESLRVNEQKLREAERRLGEIDAVLAGEDREMLNQNLKNLEKILEMLHKKKELEKIEEILSSLKDEIKKIDYREDELMQLEEDIRKLLSTESSIRASLEGLMRLVKEKEKRMEELERIGKRMKQLEKDVSARDVAIEELERFRSVLERSQLDLREEFVAALNYNMSKIWEVLYPYRDYCDVKLFPDKEYTLKLLNTEGLWVDAESFVSGGERMTAALTLRLALASILNPKLKIMILDEPTHNLDTNAIEELGRTLRERMTEIMQQVILITHDELLAESASMKLYRFERGDEKKDVTRISEMK